MVYGLYRALPGDRALLPPSFRRANPANLNTSVGVSGPHDFAVRKLLARQARRRVPLRVRDVAQRPSEGRDGANTTTDLGF
jgi:hypothetical protein